MKEEIEKALRVLQEGGTVLYPTDTIWGIGCDATDTEAVKKIFKIKQRNESKSLIVLLNDENKLFDYVKEVPPLAFELIAYTQRPLTIIYPGAKNIAPNAVAEDGSIAIRITKDEFCRSLINRLKKPLISTSANISGETAPASFSLVSPAILHSVDYVVNLRQEEKAPAQPSIIIKLELNGEFKIIRK